MVLPSWIQAVSRIGDLAATVAAMGAVQHCDVQVWIPLNPRQHMMSPLNTKLLRFPDIVFKSRGPSEAFGGGDIEQTWKWGHKGSVRNRNGRCHQESCYFGLFKECVSFHNLLKFDNLIHVKLNLTQAKMLHVHVYNGWSPSAKWLLRCSGSTGAFQQDKKALIFDIEWTSEGCGIQQWGVPVSREHRLLLCLSDVAFPFNSIFNEIHYSSLLSFWPSFMLGRLQWPHWLQWRRNTYKNKMRPIWLLLWYIWIIQAYSIHRHWGSAGGRK